MTNLPRRRRPAAAAGDTALAVTHLGLEPVLAAELTALGAGPGRVIAGGVEFPADRATLWRANLGLRTASRVLLRIGSFHAGAFHELERHAKRIPWERFLAPGTAAHVRVTTRKSKLYHERAVVERLGAAIAGRSPGIRLVEARGDAQDLELDPTAATPVQRFLVHLELDECLVSVDSSGPLLHRRGYRVEVAKAPLRETLAAGLLLAAGWDGTVPLVDPMCGSGTIPIEAALLARGIAPGLGRRFAFEQWPDFDGADFVGVKEDLRGRARARAPAPIVGADRDPGAIEAARGNAARAGVAGDIEWRRGAISTLAPPAGPGMIVTNPPYGARIGERARLRDLYAQLGNVARRVAAGWRLVLVSADRRLDGQVGVRWRELVRTENGGLPVRFLASEVVGVGAGVSPPGSERAGSRPPLRP